MTRPRRLLLVVGTATEIGKTWVTCALARHAGAEGVAVAARKPAQSYDPPPAGGQLPPTDADLLGEATGAPPHEVCPPHRWYPVAMAPPMAADVLGRPPVLLRELVDELRWPDDVDVGFVEAAGGVRSPIAHDGDAVDLARLVDPDRVLLVADAGLGTINAVRMSVAALAGWPVTVVLNRYDGSDELHARNAAWLRDIDGFDVVVDLAATPL